MLTINRLSEILGLQPDFNGVKRMSDESHHNSTCKPGSKVILQMAKRAHCLC